MLRSGRAFARLCFPDSFYSVIFEQRSRAAREDPCASAPNTADMQTDLKKRNNIHLSGSGETTLVFAHGYGCDQNMWRRIIPYFERDYRILCFDHVGSGKSDERAYDFDKYASLQGYADDVAEICAAFCDGNTVFAGHSVSAMIGVLAASGNPELFSRMVLVGPSPCYVNDGDYIGGFTPSDIDELIFTLENNYLGWSRHIAPVIAGGDENADTARELENSFCRMNPAIAKHFAKVTFTSDNRGDLMLADLPALVIQCNPDVIAPVEVGKYVADRLPQGTYTELKVPGHCPHLTAPEATAEAVHTFLNEIS